MPEVLPVIAELGWEPVVPGIIAAGSEARMIVLQRRTLSRVVRVLTRSVSSGVAAHARVPVVSVPAGWQTSSFVGETPTVAVGLDVVESSEGILRVALGVARERVRACGSCTPGRSPMPTTSSSRPCRTTNGWHGRQGPCVRCLMGSPKKQWESRSS